MGDVVRLGVEPDIWTVAAYEAPLRDNRDVMEYPFLALEKGRRAPLRFQGKRVHLSVHAPVEFGIATIWDWDLMIFAASHLNEALERGHKPPPQLRFVPHDALRQMRRSTGGKDYRELARAVRRLRVTTVITNVRFEDGAGEEAPFSWLAGYVIPKQYGAAMTPDTPHGDPDPSRLWEIELPPWLYQAIMRRRDILAVHPDYYDLTGGIERWLYRLARKAVPDKADFPQIGFRLDTLFERSGLSGRMRQFRAKLLDIAARQPLPEYDIAVSRERPQTMVTLMRNRAKPGRLPRGVRRAAVG